MKAILSLSLALLIQGITIGQAKQKDNLIVKEVVETSLKTKQEEYNKITISEKATFVVSKVVIVNKSLWANSADINIKFKQKGVIVVRGGKTNIINSKILRVSKTARLRGFKTQDYIKIWSLEGKLLYSDKYTNLRTKDIPSGYYDIQVKGRGFRSDYFIGEYIK